MKLQVYAAAANFDVAPPNGEVPLTARLHAETTVGFIDHTAEGRIAG